MLPPKTAVSSFFPATFYNLRKFRNLNRRTRVKTHSLSFHCLLPNPADLQRVLAHLKSWVQRRPFKSRLQLTAEIPEAID